MFYYLIIQSFFKIFWFLFTTTYIFSGCLKKTPKFSLVLSHFLFMGSRIYLINHLYELFFESSLFFAISFFFFFQNLLMSIEDMLLRYKLTFNVSILHKNDFLCLNRDIASVYISSISFLTFFVNLLFLEDLFQALSSFSILHNG